MIKHLIKNKLTSELYEIPKKESVMPHDIEPAPGWLNQIDLLHLPSDGGFKYALNVIDVHNGLCDGYPLKNKLMDNMCHVLDHIYDNSMYLQGYPRVMQADHEFHTKTFTDWCESHDIHPTFTEVNRHRQNAFVERMNKTLGTWIFQLQTSDELDTGKTSTDWVKVYPELIKILNAAHKKRKPLPTDGNVKWTPTNDDFLEPGTVVRLKIDKDVSEDIKGNRSMGNQRATDIKWKVAPTYTALPVMLPNNPPLYRLTNNKTHKKVNELMPRESLQRVKQNQP